MQPIATDDTVAWCVSLFASLTHGCAVQKRIEVMFRVVLDGGPSPLPRRGRKESGEIFCLLKNIERFLAFDAAFAKFELIMRLQ